MIWDEPVHDKTNNMACVPSKDSDQPGYPPSLIRVFAVRMKKAWVLSYPLSTQRRLIRMGRCPGWSESLLGTHHFLGFVLCWLRYFCYFSTEQMLFQSIPTRCLVQKLSSECSLYLNLWISSALIYLYHITFTVPKITAMFTTSVTCLSLSLSSVFNK